MLDFGFVFGLPVAAFFVNFSLLVVLGLVKLAVGCVFLLVWSVVVWLFFVVLACLILVAFGDLLFDFAAGVSCVLVAASGLMCSCGSCGMLLQIFLLCLFCDSFWVCFT